jgi:hypothetical protein
MSGYILMFVVYFSVVSYCRLKLHGCCQERVLLVHFYLILDVKSLLLLLLLLPR